MKRLSWLLMLLYPLSTPAPALTEDDAVFPVATLERLETHGEGPNRPLIWKGSAGFSGDLWGLRLKSEGERRDGVTEEAELELRARRALSAFWNLEAGWRRDLRPRPQRDRALLGLAGTLPYHIETEITAYLRDEGNQALRLEAHHELLFTQRLVLRSAVEMDAYSDSDPVRGHGSGLAESELGLRLGYELHRKFTPYVGVEHKRVHGETADRHRAADETVSETVLVGGLRLWY